MFIFWSQLKDLLQTYVLDFIFWSLVQKETWPLDSDYEPDKTTGKRIWHSVLQKVGISSAQRFRSLYRCTCTRWELVKGFGVTPRRCSVRAKSQGHEHIHSWLPEAWACSLQNQVEELLLRNCHPLGAGHWMHRRAEWHVNPSGLWRALYLEPLHHTGQDKVRAEQAQILPR